MSSSEAEFYGSEVYRPDMIDRVFPIFRFLTSDTSVPVLIVYGASEFERGLIKDILHGWMSRLIESNISPIVTDNVLTPRCYSIITQGQQHSVQFNHPYFTRFTMEYYFKNCKTIIMTDKKPPQDMCCVLRADILEY